MSKRFEKILAPIDFDDAYLEVLDYAVEFARQADGTLYLLHVVPDDEFHLLKSAYRPEESGGANPDFAREVAREKLEEIADQRIGEGIPREVLTASGDPADTILSTQRALAADLVVLSTHGRKGLSHLVLGSVAEKVVRCAPCPVLTVHRPVLH